QDWAGEARARTRANQAPSFTCATRHNRWMLDLSGVLEHWGYLGIFVVVVLGNLGLPVPEESVLALAGYLVHEGKMRLSLTLAVGILSAVVGDNVGYWIGRRLGRPALERYGTRVGVTRERMEAIARFVERY